MSNSNQPPGKPPVKTVFGVGAPVLPQQRPPGAQQPAAQPPAGAAANHPGQTILGVHAGQLPATGAPGQQPMQQQPGQQQPYPGQPGQPMQPGQHQPYTGQPGQPMQQQPYPGQQQMQPGQQPPYPGQQMQPGQQQPYPGQQPMQPGQQQPYPGQQMQPGQQQPYPGQQMQPGQQQPYPGQQPMQPGQQPYPGQQQPYPGQPPQFGHQGMANLASRLPSSKPGTLFGIPLATLRDPAVEKRALTIAGILLLAAIFVPIGLKGKTRFVWDGDTFEDLVWPIIAGLSYLLVAFTPANLRQSIPPVVMKWLPFGVAFASILILNRFFPFVGDSTQQWFANVGYAVLIFALLATLANPQDQTARLLIGVGAGLLVIPWLSFVFDVAFEFKERGVFLIIHNLLQAAALTLGVACAAFVVKPETVPALRGVDAFKPLVTALLLVWLPLKAALIMLFMLTKMKMGADAVLLGAHWLVAMFAYFGILMLTAPEAYDELIRLFTGQGGGPTQPPYGHGYGQQPGQAPPQQPGGYPQQPGGYVQQQGGYPPQPGGYPPQPGGGGYPPGGGGQ